MKNTNNNLRWSSRKGFTLVEGLVVLVIIAFVGTLLAASIKKAMDQANQAKKKIEADKAIMAALGCTQFDVTCMENARAKAKELADKEEARIKTITDGLAAGPGTTADIKDGNNGLNDNPTAIDLATCVSGDVDCRLRKDQAAVGGIYKARPESAVTEVSAWDGLVRIVRIAFWDAPKSFLKPKIVSVWNWAKSLISSAPVVPTPTSAPAPIPTPVAEDCKLVKTGEEFCPNYTQYISKEFFMNPCTKASTVVSGTCPAAAPAPAPAPTPTPTPAPTPTVPTCTLSTDCINHYCKYGGGGIDVCTTTNANCSVTRYTKGTCIPTTRPSGGASPNN